MYYRLIPTLAVLLVVCCIVWALASAFGGNRVGYGGFYPGFWGGSSWSHGGYYHGGSFGGSSGSFGSSGRSPSGSFGGGGTTGGHGGK